MGSLAATTYISGATQGQAYTMLLADLAAMSSANGTDLIAAADEYDSIKFDDVEVTSIEGVGSVSYSSAKHKEAIRKYVKNSLLKFFHFVDVQTRLANANSGSMNVNIMR